MRKKVILITGIILVCVCALLLLKIFEGDDVKVANVDSEQCIKIYLKGDLEELKSNDLNEVIKFLSTTEKLGVSINAEEEFILKNKEVDSIGFTHYKLQQVVQNIPVYNGELIVHVKEKNIIYLINGNYQENATKVKINLNKLLNKSDIEKNAIEAVKECDHKSAKAGEVLVYPLKDGYTLVYDVKVDCTLAPDKIYRVFVDGYSGEVYDYYNIVKTK